ncbi:hypothetical protein ACWCZ5_19315 [Streptomyces sp. NPDC001667]
MSLADEYGTDVEIYRRDDTVYADTRTGAPAQLLERLDSLGFTRKSRAIHTWHELPEGLNQTEVKRRSIRAVLLLTAAGYDANISHDLYDKAVHTTVVAQAKSASMKTTRVPPRPTPSPSTRRNR